MNQRHVAAEYLSSVEGRGTEQEGREMSIPLMITITEQFHQKLTSMERLGHTHSLAQLFP